MSPGVAIKKTQDVEGPFFRGGGGPPPPLNQMQSKKKSIADYGEDAKEVSKRSTNLATIKVLKQTMRPVKRN